MIDHWLASNGRKAITKAGLTLEKGILEFQSGDTSWFGIRFTYNMAPDEIMEALGLLRNHAQKWLSQRIPSLRIEYLHSVGIVDVLITELRQSSWHIIGRGPDEDIAWIHAILAKEASN